MDSGALGCRTISAGRSEFMLYWLKSQGHQSGAVRSIGGGTPTQVQKVMH